MEGGSVCVCIRVCVSIGGDRNGKFAVYFCLDFRAIRLSPIEA